MTAQDPALRAIAEKVERAERLTRQDGLALFTSSDLLTLGRLADQANGAKNGDRVYFARIERMPAGEVLAAMRDAGVTSLPGGGAEVFSPAARATIADKKLSGDEWLAVHREAHRLGIPSNCTMLYGHVETMADRVDHLLALRALQDETGGFLCYIPLAYHPHHNELGEALGRSGTATTGCDDLKNIAVGRLLLANIPHVKTHWPLVTPVISQAALGFGCDDLEGTVVC